MSTWNSQAEYILAALKRRILKDFNLLKEAVSQYPEIVTKQAWMMENSCFAIDAGTLETVQAKAVKLTKLENGR